MATTVTGQFRRDRLSDPDTVRAAITDVWSGRPVIVVDEDREDEGHLIMAAEHATAHALAFYLRHTSGLICAPMAPEVADRLRLRQMVDDNEDPAGTAYTVSVDAAAGIESGISAADRACTLRLLADPATTAEMVRRPGHVFPLRANAGGLAGRRGHTEAAVALVRLSGLAPVALISAVCDDDGSVARLPQLRALAGRHWLNVVSIDQIVAFAPPAL
ncbi:3,4-dihydroxy-2-butanone-4-phosphate synthase [Actinophytocola algeriensis]|uniref:3,4-dihydroxy-2-butanone 4-phosphate synthase n=1 Tax=Actinophytocola algeriensis TaxID=1768010 RepID=A0A7W7Q7V0_9PSEU|nr:3,4-dihydroxy-2-butanone-4-phosphate synthase [Actinophytocola algeriensis]MBB4908453.1 3,4-dihydroxy 2-butanone 4-phosphate synthase/GTP cyclohydrolase II [Actinophytocola algeriensis]MBE1475160.1 3,4-dihydroxy 2-butanone 4-phosphate synthase/GTP cyclohydrolase II [Actinophytocola algeriensis]